MAFTLTPVLSVLLPLLAAALAVYPPTANSLGGPNSIYNPLGTSSAFGGSGGYPGGGLSGGVPGLSGYHPGGHAPPRRPRKPKGVVRAKNSAGDKLLLTIEAEEDYSQSGPYSSGNLLGRFQFSFPGNPFQRGGGRSRDLRVHGIFIKAGSDSGIASQDSLHGTFAMVVMTNGNTAGACSGTGRPYTTGGKRTPYGRGSYGGNPYGNLFGGGGLFQRNPFYSQRGGYGQQQQIVVVSTPLKATHNTATIEGKLRNVKLSEILGRSIQVCPTVKCSPGTDMCGIIGYDTLSIEEFAQKKHQHAALLKLHAQGANALPSTNPLAPAGYSNDDSSPDLFAPAQPPSGLGF